ncbi:hypothetical protein A6302_04315 [Methylobrevis pamukkalensis]|uniref:Uncharacterized protein n=1 Tax=Methylobrevis pamukkalensis TaxID=1439726 RepID=A0A1E3GWD5_9HYPH|nr:hypothetical protein A6302_04315 [Methylobrevis pamukkalensis]
MTTMRRMPHGHLPTTMDFAAVSDHVRLPGRFFAALVAADGTLRR